MPLARYNEFTRLVKRNAEQFEAYEGQCRESIRRLREGLVTYLGCPDDKIALMQHSSSQSKQELKTLGVVEMSLDRRLALHDDAFYRFALQFDFGPKLFRLRLGVKRLNDDMVFEIGKDTRRIQAKSDEQLAELCEHLCQLLSDFVETEFDTFLRGQRSELGFLKTVRP